MDGCGARFFRLAACHARPAWRNRPKSPPPPFAPRKTTGALPRRENSLTARSPFAKIVCMGSNQPPEHALLLKLRTLCAELPETTEIETWGHPTFRVREKIFAGFSVGESGPSIGCKQTHADQAVLVKDPRFSVARYVGRHGWISLVADEVPWPMIEDLVLKSYRLIAPKTLARRV